MPELLFDGVELSTFAWNVTSRSSRWGIAGRQGENAVLPGVHGAMYVPGKMFNENTLLLTMWAVGSNPDGTFPSDRTRHQKCLENLEALMVLFTTPGLRPVRQYQADGSIRELFGEVVEAIDISSMAGGSRAEFAVEIRVPGVFWFDAAAINQTLSVTSADQTLTFTSFNGTAPLVNANFEVTGPATNPMLIDPTTGQWVQRQGSQAGGVKWIFDSSNWTTTVAGANALATTVHGMGATWLDLSARQAGAQVRVTGANGGTVKITAKRAWLIA